MNFYIVLSMMYRQKNKQKHAVLQLRNQAKNEIIFIVR